MENKISYEQYLLIGEQYKKRLAELPFNKESKEDRKRLLDDYVDFMLKHTDYYIRYMEEHRSQETKDISSEVNDVIEKFNERIQSGDYSTGQCYEWLIMEKNRLQYEHPGMVYDFQFLYPERINVGNIMKNVKKAKG